MSMSNVAALEPCPHCGVQLTRSLVAAVRDREQEESCPSRPKPVKLAGVTVPESDSDLASKRLMAYMILGRLAGVKS